MEIEMRNGQRHVLQHPGAVWLSFVSSTIARIGSCQGWSSSVLSLAGFVALEGGCSLSALLSDTEPWFAAFLALVSLIERWVFFWVLGLCSCPCSQPLEGNFQMTGGIWDPFACPLKTFYYDGP
ncbi:hypothetical protein IV203_034168 [Nitzschia inconspicua]|uniref:Uncharacterized protein n=1 Tax=Nitzschia inconspicua TaxID=303405 RepID=A0A9K3M3J9_9STRA|nr:hypothetical protein IV203_034168 [Nitzschia inconspicua]